MKKELLIAASLLLPFCLSAQITLTSSNAPSLAVCQANDTANTTEVTGTLPDLSPKTNATWDLTSLVDSYAYLNIKAAASSSAFPSAKFTIRAYYPFSALQYWFLKMNAVTPGGIMSYGEEIERQALPIGMLTGDPGDSLVFPQQNIVYSPARTELKYPCTMSTNWTSPSSHSTAFELTIAAYALNKTPGERRSKFTPKYTAVGWGKMRINDRTGNPSAYFDVIQVEIEESIEDSFFLAGNPAPAPLLAAFGLTQGQFTKEYSRKFYRAGEFKALVEVVYTDATFTTPKEIHLHKDRLGPVNVADMQAADISIYPNPVSGNGFTVKTGGSKAMSYQIFSVTGQMVAQGDVPASGQVTLSAPLPTGTYIVKLQNENGQQGITRLNIVN